MLKLIRNALETTGLALLFLCSVALLYGGSLLCIETVYQTFFACLLIRAGLWALKRFESKYFLVEILLELTYMLTVLVVFGFCFDWYSSLPLPALIGLGIAVYLVGCAVGTYRVANDLGSINEQLHRQKEHS